MKLFSYEPKVESALAALGVLRLTEDDFLSLALACLDQGDASLREQDELVRLIQKIRCRKSATPTVPDVR